MTKHIEMERRWLIKLPLSQEALSSIEEDGDAPTKIVQTYLKSEDGSVERLRFCETDMWQATFSHYTHTEKKLVEQGINIETENPLTKAEYQVALLERDTDHTTIEKMRYHLHHSGLLWELDMFEDKLEGLCVLELEVAHKDDLTGEIETPPYLNVEREITNESGWSNYELSLVSNLDDAETNHISKSSWFDGLVQRASSLWNAVADAVFEEHDV